MLHVLTGVGFTKLVRTFLNAKLFALINYFSSCVELKLFGDTHCEATILCLHIRESYTGVVEGPRNMHMCIIRSGGHG